MLVTLKMIVLTVSVSKMLRSNLSKVSLSLPPTTSFQYHEDMKFYLNFVEFPQTYPVTSVFMF